MDDPPALAGLSEAERAQALARYRILQPYLEGRASLTAIAQEQACPLRTLQRWADRYRAAGLAGLARKQRRDQGQRRIDNDLLRLIEGLALQKVKPSAAAIHRQVAKLALQHGWAIPSYSAVYAIVHRLDPGMMLLAHEGSKVYQSTYDLVYRREASRANEIWQADHTPLNLWLLDEKGQPVRPWLTVIEDDYSRCIAGHFLAFTHPNALNTALALRQAIWRKADPRWRICGIPDIFYTDHGSDFTSQHLEQVCADLKTQPVFSTAGMPRGRGKVERFFQTVDQLLLVRLPGYAPEGKPVTPPTLSLIEFETVFQEFLLGEYHLRQHSDLPTPPQGRWEGNSFLPRMPESLEQLDLLLLTVAKSRLVRRDGIHFQSLRYMDPTLAAYVGEAVVIRYDPRDMAEIRVYHKSTFLCRAVCAEVAGQTVSLKEIVRARNQRRRQLRQELHDYQATVEGLLNTRRNTQERRIDELVARLHEGDVLLVAELSRLGRNMFEVINLINQLSERGVKLIFIRQPELSTAGPHGKLLLAIYSYFAEVEREFISMRTQQGLAAARAQGKLLGRPKGSRDKERVLDQYREQIKEYLQLSIPLRRIHSIINPQLVQPISYPSYRYFVRQDPELLALWQAQRQ